MLELRTRMANAAFLFNIHGLLHDVKIDCVNPLLIP
jgi:hypothetical protein